MDPRIGTLVRDGSVVHYAFACGYGSPPVEGTLERVEIALGLRRKPIGKPAVLRAYAVTLTWQGGGTEEIVVRAMTNAEAVRKAREWKNHEYGRTVSCNTLPCTYRARLFGEEDA